MESIKNIQEVKDNIYLSNVFKFEDFLVNSRISQSLRANSGSAADRFTSSGGNAKLDYGIVKTVMSRLSNQYKKRNVDDVLALYPSLFMDINFEYSFMPYIQETYKSNVRPEQIKLDVYRLVHNINVMDLDRLPLEIQAMPDDMFSFGEKLYINQKDFKVDVFKRDMSNVMSKAFFVVLYYKHLISRASACAGVMSCQRIYNLAQYIFVYFTVMVMFLIVFGSQELVDTYAKETNESMENMQQLKYTLVAIMDGILARLQEKNLLNQGDKNTTVGARSAVNEYYDSIKKLSSSNKQLSQDLNTKKSNVLLMQNNLASYNSMEMVTHRAVITANVGLWVAIILSILLIGSVVVLTMQGRFAWANIVSLVGASLVILVLTKWHVKVWQFLVNLFTE